MKNKYAHIRNLSEIDVELEKLKVKRAVLWDELLSLKVDLNNKFTLKSVASDLFQEGLLKGQGINIALIFRIGVLVIRSFKSGGDVMKKLASFKLFG